METADWLVRWTTSGQALRTGSLRTWPVAATADDGQWVAYSISEQRPPWQRPMDCTVHEATMRFSLYAAVEIAVPPTVSYQDMPAVWYAR